MAAPESQAVDEYIAAQPEPVRGLLGRVRSAIRRGAPDAEETIAYAIPAYKVGGKPVLYFAGWKKHYSLYPAGEALLAAFRDELAGYTVSKGTIRFPLSEAVPVKLIERIAKFRAKEAGAREKVKLPQNAGLMRGEACGSDHLSCALIRSP